jgi:hypothetical protein
MKLIERFLLTALLLISSSAFALAQAPATNAAPPPQPQAPVAKPAPPPTQTLPEVLPAKEFARMIREFSEESGTFFSDNLLSNETAYLHIVDKLKQTTTPGGAYIGVGPEQNFTYIAKVRPRIAFIVDIRRMAATEQLMYKAIFHLSADRAEFLSRLLSKPLPQDKPFAANVPLNDLTAYFSDAPISEEMFRVNLAAITRMIEKDFEYTLSTGEQQELGYVLRSFKEEGLGMTYHWSGGYMPGYFPTLKEVITETDLSGKQGNFLASAEDYEFVRGLQMKNLIIPLTGDFAGSKAFSSVGEYLKKNGLTVSAFYTSNVEQYLFDNQVFTDFANNVRKLPVNDQSVFIRSVLSRFGHPAMSPGHQFAILLQRIPVFLKEFDEGRYRQYSSLVNSNYIAPERR